MHRPKFQGISDLFWSNILAQKNYWCTEKYRHVLYSSAIPSKVTWVLWNVKYYAVVKNCLSNFITSLRVNCCHCSFSNFAQVIRGHSIYHSPLYLLLKSRLDLV